MTKKKILCLAVAAAMMLALLAACGNTDGSQTGVPGSSATASPSDEGPGDGTDGPA